jgi:TolA-binding protein
VSAQYGSTRSGNDAHRVIGDASFWSADYETAMTEYRAYLERDKSGILSNAVKRSLAYTLETAGKNAEAAEMYASLVGAFDRESDGEFLMGAARSQLAAGQPDQARAHLERLVNEYGETSYARRGREVLAEIAVRSGATASP